MTRELFWLTLTVILTGLLWVPYILNRITVRGLFGSMANPSRNDKPHAEWANRLMFAHDNAVENLVIFAPLVLMAFQALPAACMARWPSSSRIGMDHAHSWGLMWPLVQALTMSVEAKIKVLVSA